jgi:hypothetical protein
MRKVCAQMVPKELTEEQSSALSVREFLATKQKTMLEHTASSRDLAPNDFFCSWR